MKKAYGKKPHSRGAISFAKAQYGTDTSSFGRRTRDGFTDFTGKGNYILAESSYSNNKRLTVYNENKFGMKPPGTSGGMGLPSLEMTG